MTSYDELQKEGKEKFESTKKKLANLIQHGDTSNKINFIEEMIAIYNELVTLQKEYETLNPLGDDIALSVENKIHELADEYDDFEELTFTIDGKEYELFYDDNEYAGLEEVETEFPVVELNESDFTILLSGEPIEITDHGVAISVEKLFLTFVKELEIKPFAQRGFHVTVPAEIAQRFNQVFIVPTDLREEKEKRR